eukprot:scaffold109400_cov35-Tisochrysis_lutea.AAC.2
MPPFCASSCARCEATRCREGRAVQGERQCGRLHLRGVEWGRLRRRSRRARTMRGACDAVGQRPRRAGVAYHAFVHTCWRRSMWQTNAIPSTSTFVPQGPSRTAARAVNMQSPVSNPTFSGAGGGTSGVQVTDQEHQ